MMKQPAYGQYIGQKRCEKGTRSTPWEESPEEVAAGLEWGRRKTRMMRWVKRHMNDALSRRQREVLELHLFQGMTCAQIARLIGRDRSSVHRAVRRSVVRLRLLWEQSPQASRRKKT